MSTTMLLRDPTIDRGPARTLTYDDLVKRLIASQRKIKKLREAREDIIATMSHNEVSLLLVQTIDNWRIDEQLHSKALLRSISEARQ